VTAARRIGPGDRLGATFAFSLIAHGVLALGVGFTIDDPAPLVPTLDIILTQTRSDRTPKQADFLAQSSQQGGGESETPERPREPQPAPVPKPDDGLAPAPIEASAPVPQPEVRQPVLTTTQPAERRVDRRDLTPSPPKPLPSSRELIERSLEMARLAAELERQTAAYAKRPKRKFVSASTQEYEFASYMRAWVARVERIGNLNYPDDARRRNLLGQLVLTVAIRRDGTVESIDIVQPSGYPVLDEAATRTVRLAEPFAPLPETREKIDVLHITRTWQFLPGNVMRNQ
jgi:protein TonB